MDLIEIICCLRVSRTDFFPQHHIIHDHRRHHGAGLRAFWREGQDVPQPAGWKDERTAQPHAQRPLQLLPHTHPAGSHQREEGQESALLPQRGQILQGHCVRRGQRPVSHLRFSSGRPYTLPLWPHQFAAGGSFHLHHWRITQDRVSGWAGGRYIYSSLNAIRNLYHFVCFGCSLVPSSMLCCTSKLKSNFRGEILWFLADLIA